MAACVAELGQSDVPAVEKRLKALRKKLKQIEKLKETREDGQAADRKLDPDAQRKLDSEPELLRELEALECEAAGKVRGSQLADPETSVRRPAQPERDRTSRGDLLAEIEAALTVPSHAAMLLGPSEKLFRSLHKKLREIAKAMKQPRIDKLQEEKIQSAAGILQDFLPLRSIAMEMEYDENDIKELIAKREAAALLSAQSAAAAYASAPPAAAPAPGQLPRIGIDVGGVLNRHLNDVEDSFGAWEEQNDSAAPGAMEGLTRCVSRFGAANVFIVSKCSGEMRAKTEKWLFKTMDICKNNGVWKKNVHFCRDRFGLKGKGGIAERLELSHFVDDRDDCLWSVYDDPAGNAKLSIERHGGKLFYMARGGSGRPPRPQTWKEDERPACVIPVSGWSDVMRHLAA